MHLRSVFFATNALFLGLLSMVGMAAEKNYLPVTPTELLALMPNAPEGWKLTTSVGANDPGNHPVLGTIAQRVYRFDPPPPPPGEPAGLPMVTDIVLMDTAFERERFLVIERKPSKKPSNPLSLEKRYVVENVPVVDRVRGDSRVLMAGFNSRFLLIAKLTNQGDKEIAEWLKFLNFPSILAAACKAPKIELTPHVMTVCYVNELKPESNRTSQMFYETEEERSKQAEELLKKEKLPSPSTKPLSDR